MLLNGKGAKLRRSLDSQRRERINGIGRRMNRAVMMTNDK
jgi:hypothetical protein